MDNLRVIKVIFILLAGTIGVQAQISQTICDEIGHDYHLHKGDSLFNKKEFLPANLRFYAAMVLTCLDENKDILREKIKITDSLIIETHKENLRLRDRLIQKSQEKLEVAEKAKVEQQTVANALIMAFTAQFEIKRSKYFSAIKLAYAALDSLGRIKKPIPFVYQTFSNAAFHYFKRENKIDLSIVRGLTISNSKPEFLCFGGKRSFAFMSYSDQLQLELLSNQDDHFNYITFAAYSRDGTKSVTCSQDKTAKIWGPNREFLHKLTGHEKEVSYAEFSPDGQSVVTCSRDGKARLWRLTDKKPQGIELPMGDFVLEADFSDSGHILTRSANSKVKLWTQDGSLIREVPVEGWVYDASFFPGTNDDYYVTIDCGNGALLRKVSDDGFRKKLSNDQTCVLSLAFSEDSRYFMTTATNGTARLHQKDGTLIAALTGPTGIVTDAAISPGGDRVLAISHNEVWLWDTSGIVIDTLSEHSSRINSAEFSKDGQFILTASEDGSVKLWDRNGQLLMDMDGFETPPKEAHFLPFNQDIIMISNGTDSFTTCYMPERAKREFEDSFKKR